MNKTELRKKYKSIRKSIKDKKRRDLHIFFECINNKYIKNSTNIALYFSNTEEVDTINLIKYLLDKNKNVYLPKVIDEFTMKFIQIKDLDLLIFNEKLKIYEPKDNKENDNIDIDVFVVPLIAFNNELNRIGYGKGYYDNYFIFNNIKAYKIGLSYEECKISEELIGIFNDHDIKMDEIIYK